MKPFEHFKRFELVLYKVDVPIPKYIICECNEIAIPSSDTCAHGSTYISMYQTQHITGSFTFSSKR